MNIGKQKGKVIKMQMSKLKETLHNKMSGLTIGDIGPIALTLGIAIIVIAVVAMILSNMRDQVNNTSTAYTIIGKGLDALNVFGDWFGIIVIVAVAAIILGLVMLFRTTASGRA
jgi:branched-subunit amino acid ABC-type transport system permease component